MKQEPEKNSILVVDDSKMNLAVLNDVLSKNDYQVFLCQTGEEALEFFLQQTVDLILLDIILPGLSGYDVCEKLKQNDATKDIPVIFFTSLTKIDDKVKGFQKGAVDYLTKPLQYEEVLARIKTHLTIQNLKIDLQKRNNELQDALQREKDLNRLKSRFISMASHELRTPLTAIKANCDFVRQFGHKMENQKKEEILQTVKSVVNHMTQLLDDILTLGRSEVGKLRFEPQHINLREFCENLIHEFELGSGKNHQFQLEIIDEFDGAVMSENLLHHVIYNLISNAIKYSPKDSKVTLSLLKQDHWAIFKVSDQGIGIPVDDQEKLFEAFHRAKNVGTVEGTGLGLSIVKECVLLHQGTITFESGENKGTTFIVQIPYNFPVFQPEKTVDDQSDNDSVCSVDRG